MRRITLAAGTVDSFKGGTVDYDIRATLIALLSNASAGGGLTVSDVHRRIRILDTIEQASNYVDLEDADFEYLKSVVDNSEFLVADRHVMKLFDALEGAETV
jgi:hypothetical protein